MDLIRSGLTRLLFALFALVSVACAAQTQAGVATLKDAETAEKGETRPSDEEAEEQLVEWAQCMREHGIDMPDPVVDEDGGVMIARRVERPAAGSGGDGPPDPFGDDFRRAREECGDPPRIGGTLSEEDRQELQENALKLAQCMRDQGVTDFPDPDFSSSGPGAGPRKGEPVEGPFGSIDLDDPDVQAAFEACRDKAGGGVPFVVRGPAPGAGQGQ